MSMKIGPASVYSPITGPIEVRHGDKVLTTFGNAREASSFAQGYNMAWNRITDKNYHG